MGRLRLFVLLVVFCPCSLVLATPTAIMAAIGNATKHGFLVREGDSLERLARVKRVTFDKTGTLTIGIPKVVAVESIVENYSNEEIYSLVAGAEKNSEHPLGKAIVNCFQNDIGKKIPETTAFTMIPGQGVKAQENGKIICAGNERLFASENMVLSDAIKKKAEEYIKKGASIIYVSIDGRLSGMLALSDSLREESRNMIQKIKDIGITPVLITGDNKDAADEIAGEVGITEVNANCLPEDKRSIIDAYQKKSELVCMIGDGVNDA